MEPEAKGKKSSVVIFDEAATTPEVKPLSAYLDELHEKIDENYEGDIGDNRFTLREWSMIFAAAGKLFRIMFNDSLQKVPDDALDVVGYLEIFWKSFSERTGLKPQIRNELYR
jgi:hypothetical protein